MDYQDRGSTDPDPETPDRPEKQRAPQAEAGPVRRRGGRHRREDRHRKPSAYEVSLAGPSGADAGAPSGWPDADVTGAWPQTTETTGATEATDGGRTSVGERSGDDTGEWAYRPELYGHSEVAGADRWWDRGTDTGEWHRTADTGEWHHSTDTGEWQRLADTGEWSRGDPAEPYRGAEQGVAPSGTGQPNTFWEGIRLAGDDPRWMATPASAPRSPVVGAGGPTDGPPDDPPDVPGPHQVEAGPPGHRVKHDRHDGQGGLPMTMFYAAAWYVVPLLVLFVWMLTLDGSAPAGCVTDASGGGCESERAEAITSIVTATPRFGTAIGASLVAAMLLRWVSRAWRAASVGLAAAVIGGGLSIVLFHLIYGQPV